MGQAWVKHGGHAWVLRAASCGKIMVSARRFCWCIWLMLWTKQVLDGNYGCAFVQKKVTEEYLLTSEGTGDVLALAATVLM